MQNRINKIYMTIYMIYDDNVRYKEMPSSENRKFSWNVPFYAGKYAALYIILQRNFTMPGRNTLSNV